MYPAAEPDKAGPGRFVVMGRTQQGSAKNRFGEGCVLSERTVAIPDPLSGGRAAGGEQQPDRTQHKALCNDFLFANTPNGAQGSAIIFSLIETAKENGLDPYHYLVHVMTNAPVLAETDDCWAAKLLPEYAPARCSASPGDRMI